MKKISLIFLSLVALMFFFSCSKSENRTTPSIVGRWNFDSDRYKSTTLQGSTIVNSEDTTTYYAAGSYLELRSDGTFSSLVDSTYDNGNYTVANNKLTIMTSNDTSIVDILSLTDNLLQLHNIGSDVDTTIGYTYNWEFWINLSR